MNTDPSIPAPTLRTRQLIWAVKLLVAGLFLLQTVRGYRLPDVWPLTHYCLDYSEGFAKRALLGAVLAAVSYRCDLHVVTAIGLSLSLLLNIILFIYAIRFLNARQWLAAAAVVAFMMSPLGPFLMRNNTYLEVPIFILLCACLYVWPRLKSSNAQYLTIVAVTIVTTLIHEVALFFVPGLLGVLIVTNMKAWRRGLTLLVVTSTAMFYTASEFGVLPYAAVDRLEAHVRQRANFGIWNLVLDVIRYNAQANLDLSRETWSTSRDFFGGFFEACWRTYGAILPLLLLLFAVAGWHLYRASRGALSYLALLSCALVPLFLAHVAWDLHRWAGLSGLTTLLATVAICQSMPQQERQGTALPQRRFGLLFAALLVVVLASSGFWLHVPIFRQPFERSYPYVTIYDWQQLRERLAY